MAVAWFVVPYLTTINPAGSMPKATRTVALDSDVQAGNMLWAETEVLGNQALVKVRATVAVLTDLATRFQVLPKTTLSTSLSDLTANQKQALLDLLQQAGYSLTEIRNQLGSDLGARTLGDVLRFLATRRIPPRFDDATSAVVFDQSPVGCRDVGDVDAAV